MNNLDSFRHIVTADFEYSTDGNLHPRINCGVAEELRSGQIWRLNDEAVNSLSEPPFPTGPDAVFVCYYAMAELSAFLSLGWKFPVHVLDLYVAQRLLTNGVELNRPSLVVSLKYHGLGRFVPEEKREMRDLSIRGGPFTAEEMSGLIRYCARDVEALRPLLGAVLKRMHQIPHGVSQILWLGEYLKALAVVERRGVPVDLELVGEMKDHWPRIRERLIVSLGAKYRCYDTMGRFKQAGFRQYLNRQQIPWAETPAGRLKTSREHFKEMATRYPQIQDLAQLRRTLEELKTFDLPLGADGYHRTMLSPMGAKTGRNAPGKFVFGLAGWLRGIIQPKPGRALLYCDYSSQEPWIAATLSGDEDLLRAYASGDFYLGIAKQMGFAPPEATRKTHGALRDRFKVVALATQYGQGHLALSDQLGINPTEARNLLDRFDQTFGRLRAWQTRVQDRARLSRRIVSRLGWPLWVIPDSKQNTLLNFPMQAGGGDILRILITRLARISPGLVAAPVHDAILCECAESESEDAADLIRREMIEAGRIFSRQDLVDCRVDTQIIRHPNRYQDGRGGELWGQVMGWLGRTERPEMGAKVVAFPASEGKAVVAPLYATTS